MVNRLTVLRLFFIQHLHLASPDLGKTTTDGTFGLTTFRATPGAGAAPGEYVVTISKEEWPEFKEPEDDDPNYERKMAQVEAEMDRAKPTYVTPQAYGDEETSGLTATVGTGGKQNGL